MVMIYEVPHMSQEFLHFVESIDIISFLCLVSCLVVVPFDVGHDSVRRGAGFRCLWGTIPVKWGSRVRLAPLAC